MRTNFCSDAGGELDMMKSLDPGSLRTPTIWGLIRETIAAIMYFKQEGI
jgi:hypothetical protein